MAFSGNQATVDGGMYANSGSSMLMNVTFSGNWALHGGGHSSASSRIYFVNVTFSGNTAIGDGGGLYNQGGVIMLVNSTLHGNGASGSGGGFFNAGASDDPSMISNSILWDNTASSGAQLITDTNTLYIANSVVQDGCPQPVFMCMNLITSAPLLGELSGNGGAIQTIPLLPGSPAIDAGDNGCPLATTDACGAPRPQGSACDIGAYEAHPFTLQETTGDGQSALVGSAYAAPLGVRVSNAFDEPVDGGVITFTAPATGASVTPATTSLTIEDGEVSQAVTANLVAGSFTVNAAARGAAPLSFNLTNIKRSSSVALASSDSPSAIGQGVTFIATVSGVQPGGSATFVDSGTDIAECVDAPVHQGRAMCFITTLAHGAHTIEVEYHGDVYHDPSRAILAHFVQANTSTRIASSQNPSLQGHPVTFTVTVTAAAPGSGTPTGSVALFASPPPDLGVAEAQRAAQTLASAPLENGVAVFRYSTLPIGTNTLLAVYDGDTSFRSSESSFYLQVVNSPLRYLYFPWMFLSR